MKTAAWGIKEASLNAQFTTDGGTFGRPKRKKGIIKRSPPSLFLSLSLSLAFNADSLVPSGAGSIPTPKNL